MLYSLWLFHKKLFVPSISFAILFGSFSIYVNSNFTLVGVGVSYLFLSLFFHYFIYEIRNINDYYFYYNLGLSKIILWISTLIFSLIIGIAIIILGSLITLI